LLEELAKWLILPLECTWVYICLLDEGESPQSHSMLNA